MLAQFHGLGGGKGEDESDGGDGGHRGVRFIVVSAELLCIAAGRKAGFVSNDAAERVALDLENPFRFYRAGTGGHSASLNRYPSLALAQHSEFCLNGLFPVWRVSTGDGLMIGGGRVGIGDFGCDECPDLLW